MFCDHCGNQIEEKAIVCVKCGMSTNILANIIADQEIRNQNVKKKFTNAGFQLIESGDNLLRSLNLQFWMGITNIGFGILLYYINENGPWEEGFYKLIYWGIFISNLLFIRAIYLKMLKGFEKLTEAGFTISETET